MIGIIKIFMTVHIQTILKDLLLVYTGYCVEARRAVMMHVAAILFFVPVVDPAIVPAKLVFG